MTEATTTTNHPNDPETPYALEVDQNKNDDNNNVESGLSLDETDGEEEAGFYICKNWFARKPFGGYPDQGYKPVFLSELHDGLWYEFNREVQHNQKYQSRITWTYKFCIIAPTLWFLFIVLPDLMYYNEIIFKGVGVVCGLVLALAVSVDTYYQRRFQHKKVHPMFSLLIETYKSRFLLHGYSVSYDFEPTAMEGMNSYIVFRKSSTEGKDLLRPVVDSSQMGFYMDEDLLGKRPYALGMASPIHPPRFLRGIDAGTWKAFAKAVDDRSKTPRSYLLSFTIGMGLLVSLFVAALIYAVVVLVEVRHVLLITLFPLVLLVETMKSFRRRHYLENVLADDMRELLTGYERAFAVAGFGASFELEYVYHYLCCNSYFNFWKLDSKYEPATPALAPVGEIA